MTLCIWLVPVLLGFAILTFAHFHRRTFTASIHSKRSTSAVPMASKRETAE